MKTYGIIIALMFLSFKLEQQGTYCLEVSGTVIASSTNDNDAYKAVLYDHNVKIDSLELSVDQPFKFNLKSNERYTIKIEKKGYIDRIIEVETTMDSKYTTDLFKLKFEIELASEEDFEGISKTYFSAVSIYFDNKKGWFSHIDPASQNSKSYGFAMDITNVFQYKQRKSSVE